MANSALPKETLRDLIDESVEHARRNTYNIDSHDVAATCIDESAEMLGVELDDASRAEAIQGLLNEVSN